MKMRRALFPAVMDLSFARREFKFRLNGERASLVMGQIRERMPKDCNGAGGSYPVVSEYYDTPEREALWERDRKFGNRRKLRLRIYGTRDGAIPPSAFIEIKHKQDGLGVKRRIALPVDSLAGSELQLRALLESLRSRLRTRSDLFLIEEIARLVESRRLVPSLQMRYDRTAFEDEDSGLRITFDRAIKCRRDRLPLQPDDPDFPLDVLSPEESLMEVKLFGAAPYWLRQMTAEFGLTRIPFSKYCTALRMHDSAILSITASRLGTA
jgi:hypothetical protein